MTGWTGTSVFLCPWTGAYILSTSCSWAFRLRLDLHFGSSGAQAFCFKRKIYLQLSWVSNSQTANCQISQRPYSHEPIPCSKSLCVCVCVCVCTIMFIMFLFLWKSWLIHHLIIIYGTYIENSSFYHIKKNLYALWDLSSLTRDQICVLNSESTES